MEQLASSAECTNKTLLTVPTENIHPNPNQPRRHFDPNKIELLGQSIVEIGQKDPITVRLYPTQTCMKLLRVCNPMRKNSLEKRYRGV